MKVIFITKTLNEGGAASGARNLLAALRAAGAEVITLDAYARQRHRPIRLLRTVERVYERLVHDAETHCVRLGPPTFDLKALYAEYRPDVIQLCDVSANTISFADIGPVPCPVVHRMSDFWPYHGAHHYAVHPPAPLGLADRMLRRLIFDGSAKPDCCIAPSDWLADRLCGDDIEIIRNAVAVPAHVRPRSAHRGTVRLGFISGQILDPRKGFETLPPFLDALRGHDCCPVELHVFGRLPKTSLPRFDQALVISHPPFAPSELGSIYDTFDILLCPSRRDNSPNVVTEAFAHGVPVIAQSGTGMDSYVETNRGALVDYQDVSAANIQQFASAVENIIAEFQNFSNNAYDFVRNELTAAIIGAHYMSLYKRVIQRKTH